MSETTQLYNNFDKYLNRITEENNTLATYDIDPDRITSGSSVSTISNVSGSVFSGKNSYSNTETGYILGVDEGVAKFYIGTPTNYFNFDGTNVSISGSLSAGTIDIGGSDASSFHVDSGGNTWWGAATLANGIASIDSSGNMSISSLSRKDFHWFTLFESMDGYGKSIDAGGAISIGQSYITITTHDNNGDKAELQKVAYNGGSPFSWDKRRRLKTQIRIIEGEVNRSIYIVCGDGQNTNGRKIGFWIDNYTLYAVVADGSDRTLINYGTFSANTDYILEFDYIPGTSVTFYVNGSNIGTTTTTLPSGSTSANYLLDIVVKTLENTAMNLWIMFWDFWQAN